ncbi:MAG: type II secretion system F family protein [Kineosporiaceae bacterium]
MTATSLAALAGGLFALGGVLIAWRFTPAHPDLATALDGLDPEHSLTPPVAPIELDDAVPDRVGRWLYRHLPLPEPPAADLALLGMPASRFHGQKLLYALFGMVFPLLPGTLVMLVGVRVPWVFAGVASVLTAIALSFLPDYNVRSDATRAREEFTRALGAYIDLVALERLSGAGPRQAMESAAQVGDSWPFRRLAEELARSRWSGVPPWDALARLAGQLELNPLADLADIMRLSGEEGAAVYQTLRARSAAIRAALVTEDLARVNRAAERLTLPGAVLALTFAVLLTAPALMRLLIT